MKFKLHIEAKDAGIENIMEYNGLIKNSNETPADLLFINGENGIPLIADIGITCVW